MNQPERINRWLSRRDQAPNERVAAFITTIIIMFIMFLAAASVWMIASSYAP